jgi:SAM-dependent methyltransferase
MISKGFFVYLQNMQQTIEQFFSYLPQQMPGCEEATLRALSYVKDSLNWDSRILDLGCGTGRHSLTLADNTSAQVVAVDPSSLFLKVLGENVGDRNIVAKQAELQQLDFAPESFDAVWSEGASKEMGFKDAVKAWSPFLISGGYLVLSDLAWTGMYRPYEVDDFLTKHYSHIGLVSEFTAILECEGFSVAASFAMPEDGWEREYFRKILRQEVPFLRAHPECSDFIDDLNRGIDIRRKYGQYFDIVFFIARKL